MKCEAGKDAMIATLEKNPAEIAAVIYEY